MTACKIDSNTYKVDEANSIRESRRNTREMISSVSFDEVFFNHRVPFQSWAVTVTRGLIHL